MTTDRPPPRSRFHGRFPGQRPCARAGCDDVGEFRAPGARRPGFDGPGQYQWLCLDHVREFNAGYNYFTGMSPDEIVEAQSPYGGWADTGWATETRAFAQSGADMPPRWSDFRDPMEAMSARFRRGRVDAEARAASVDPVTQAALQTLGLSLSADLRAIRRAYSDGVRRYHPDRNGGDRRHEAKLQAVLEAWTHLRQVKR